MRTLHAEASVLWMPNLLVTHFDSSRSLSLTNTRFTFDRLLVSYAPQLNYFFFDKL